MLPSFKGVESPCPILVREPDLYGVGLDAFFAPDLRQARIGQKNKITRRWAKRGTRPRGACKIVGGQ